MFFLTFIKVKAQENNCGDIPYDMSIYQNYGGNQALASSSTTTIKVYFIVYRDDDGSAGVSNSRLVDIIKRLNTSFSAAGFDFVWRQCETIYINNSELNETTNACIFEEIHSDGLNIHIRGDNKAYSARTNSIPGTVVFVGGTKQIDQGHSNSGDVASASNTVVHEVGHSLGLFHTHHGSCSAVTSTILCPSDQNSLESPNGDMVDDTPLDPNLERKINIGTCTWNGVKCNISTIPIINPLTDNFMSYTRPSCMTSFTSGQITRMKVLCPPNIKYEGPTKTPTLAFDEVSNLCPNRTYDLDPLVNSPLPCGAELRWSTDGGPLNSTSPIISNIVSQTGVFYAYYYYSDENSYGPASNPVYFFRSQCCGDKDDLIITSNMEINQNQDMGNIKIKSGFTLTIKSTLQFADDKGIEVEMGAKLVIDGGTLTKCPLVESWKGIKVAGDLLYIWGFGLPTTEVTLKNGGSITNALTGIDALDQITIFTTSDIGGAKIIIEENSSITNCEIGVKLGPIYGYVDLSVFDNATFSNNGWAVQLHGNNGLNVTNSTFKYNYLDIQGFASSVKADNNTFNDGVEFSSQYPVFTGSTFTNNDFFGSIIIESLSNSTDFYIQNNEFFGTGLLTLGELDFDITRNDFHESGEGTWISESGDNINNFVTANNFYDNGYGNSASGINDTEYEKNCFSGTDTWDIEVNEGASIHELQGAEQDAAGNCFSKKIGTASTSDFFDYYVLQNTIPQSCKKPGYSGNFTEQVATQDIANSCGSGNNIYGPIPARYRDCTYTNAADLKQMMTYLRNQILMLEANTTMNPWIKKWLIAKYKRCLDRAIKYQAKSDLDQKGKDFAIVFLVAQPEFRYQAAAYGIYMEHNETAKARTVLNSLPTNDAGESEFVDVQNIYLDYLADRAKFSLSKENTSVIYNAGLRKHPLAGFARSVYHTFTGQKIPVTLTHLNGNTQTRSKNNIEPNVTTKIYPNPTDQQRFTIEMSDFDPNTQYQCTILDIFGQVVGQSNLSQSTQDIRLQNAVAGIYIVKISNFDKIVHVEKLIVK